MTRLQRCRGDDGATLVIVLAIVAVFGLLISAVLGQTTTNLGATLVTRAQDEKVFGADSGIDAGIQKLRGDDTLCPRPMAVGTEQQILSLPSNGKTVAVSCRTVSGRSVGAEGFAAVITDSDESGVTSPGLQQQGGGTPSVQGSIYAHRIDDGSSFTLAVRSGDVLEHSSSCSNVATDKPSGLVVSPDPPYRYACSSDSWTRFDPKPAFPSSPGLVDRDSLAAAGGLRSETDAGCRIFLPGKYTVAPVWGTKNYLASGLYYFEDVAVTVDKAEVVGGAQGPDPEGADRVEPSINGTTACATDGDVPSADQPAIRGTGVTIVLGGTASLRVSSAAPGAKVELYTRTGAIATQGLNQVSITAVPSYAASSTWKKSTGTVGGSGSPVVLVDSGTNPALAVHGLIYAPHRFIDFNATNSSVAQLVGGVVAGRLRLQASASGAGLGVSVAAGPGRRRIEITAVASESGGRPITSRAVIDIANDGPRTATVTSWYNVGN